MDESILAETLGFTIRDGVVYWGGNHQRPATVPEALMWRLLTMSQSRWHEFDGTDT